jgi:hypothetical protein
MGSTKVAVLRACISLIGADGGCIRKGEVLHKFLKFRGISNMSRGDMTV